MGTTGAGDRRPRAGGVLERGRVRAEIATMPLDAMSEGRGEAVNCRAPEFYGPGKTRSLTNSLVFDRIKAGRRPLVPAGAKPSGP